MREIYLDNSAAGRPFPEVLNLVSRIQEKIYGNPSSLHEKGLEAEREITEARRTIASLFRHRENEIVFTSGGTEANNLAVKGVAMRRRRRGRHLITTTIEHPSVLNCYRFLEKIGFDVTYLPVDSTGLVDPQTLKNALTTETTLVSIMHVNNEIGTVQKLEELGHIIKKNGSNEKAGNALFHVDAVQSFARLPLDVDRFRIDLVSCSAHKIHGPRGAGCLFVREGILLEPLMHGGGQEREMRPGTENTAAIAGFGLAARLCAQGGKKAEQDLAGLKHRFLGELQSLGVQYAVNGPQPAEAASHIVNLSFPGLKAEVLLHALEEQGIFVSAGSACHARRPDPSHVLQAIGLSKEHLEGALRFSFARKNSEQEIKTAAAVISAVTKELRSVMG